MGDTTVHLLLEKDLQNTMNLENLLRAEREQLECRDIGALSKTLIVKAEILAAIEHNDEARRKILASSGYPADNQGLKQYCTDSEQGVDALEALHLQLRKCAELTDLNGAIVHRSRINTRQVLDIMQGKTKQSGLYTSQGGTKKTTESRAIAKA